MVRSRLVLVLTLWSLCALISAKDPTPAPPSVATSKAPTTTVEVTTVSSTEEATTDAVTEPTTDPATTEPVTTPLGTTAPEATTATDVTTLEPEVTSPKPGGTTNETTVVPVEPGVTTVEPETSTDKNDTTSTNTSITSTSTTTVEPETPTTYKPGVSISSINEKNYTFVEHTSFNHSMHLWDFEGLWNKYNLRDMKKPPIPLPRPGAPKTRMMWPVEGGGDPGAAMGGGGTSADQPNPPEALSGKNPSDNNNYVMMNYVSRVGGVLSKSFDNVASGEIIINYYILLDDVTLTVTMINSNGTRIKLLETDDPEEVWYTVSVPFTEDQTLLKKFRLELRVLKKLPHGSGKVDPQRAFALHHMVVGGFRDRQVVLPDAAAQSNATILPPGSMSEIELLADRIWTALYVFLAFFILCIVALVAVVAKGRLR